MTIKYSVAFCLKKPRKRINLPEGSESDSHNSGRRLKSNFILQIQNRNLIFAYVEQLNKLNCKVNTEALKKEATEKLYFISFCMEQYKKHISATGDAVIELFEQYDIISYLHTYYNVLHTQGAQWLMEEIDNLIKERQDYP